MLYLLSPTSTFIISKLITMQIIVMFIIVTIREIEIK
jgi:hypothetical protein